MKHLLHDTYEKSVRYLEEIQERSVAPAPDAVANLRLLQEPLPQKASPPEQTLQILDEVVSPATMGMAGPRFFGFVIGGSLPVALAANWLAGAWDQNSAMHLVTPGTSALEEVALGWLLEILGLPRHSGGAFVTGATVTNFCALAAARHAVLKKVGWNVEADGLFGAPAVTVVVSAEAHPSVTKSLGLIGFGRNRVIRVPVDKQGRMRADKLPEISGPAIICVQFGNVNTGAFDPLIDIAPWTKKNGTWIHVDGAFGLWAAASSTRKHLTRGIELADSWATDAHKWLNVPYDSGIAFVRDANALKAAMAISAEYLPTATEHRNPSDFTPELSRRARGVEVWAALHSLGRTGVANLIDRNCAQACRFADRLSGAGFEILNDVVLNQVLVSFGSSEKTKRVIEAIQKDGTAWAGITVWQNKTAMRISVSSWATTNSDIDRSANAIIRLAQTI